MLLRIIALGALGYAGYRYLNASRAGEADQSEVRDLRIAGGPLSKDATLVRADDPLFDQ